MYALCTGKTIQIYANVYLISKTEVYKHIYVNARDMSLSYSRSNSSLPHVSLELL